MSVHEQFCQTKNGKKFLYLAEKFLDHVKEEVENGENRTYHKEYRSVIDEFEFCLEFRGFAKFLFHAEYNGDRISLIVFNRDTKEYPDDTRHLEVDGKGINCKGFIYFEPIFKKIKSVDSAIHRANRNIISLELDKNELELLGFEGKEEVKDALQQNFSLKQKINKSNLNEETKEEIHQKLEPIHDFLKHKKKLNQEQKHNFERLLEEDLPNLIESFIELDGEERIQQKEDFLEALNGIAVIAHEETKGLTMANFKKHLTLFKKRYQ